MPTISSSLTFLNGTSAGIGFAEGAVVAVGPAAGVATLTVSASCFSLRALTIILRMITTAREMKVIHMQTLKATIGCVDVEVPRTFAMASMINGATTLPIESMDANQASVSVKATRVEATDRRS